MCWATSCVMTMSKSHSPARTWLPHELNQLREHYPNQPTKDLAQALGRGVGSVYNTAHALGLKKTSEYLRSQASGRLQSNSQTEAMVLNRFAPGAEPWNKGKAFQAGGRSADTQFRTGAKPHNYKPVGSLRVTKDGILQRKVSDAQGPPNLRWRSVSELVWISTHGPVPPGHIVVFKPGMRTIEPAAITVDKLDCISRQENAHRNCGTTPLEIKRLHQLRGALTRQIKKRTPS